MSLTISDADESPALPPGCRGHPTGAVECFVDGWRASHPALNDGQEWGVHCRSWRCRRDAARQQSAVAYAVARHVKNGLRWFWTLTLHPGSAECTPCATRITLSESLRRLRDILRARGVKYEFVRVNELTGRGSFHAHVLTDRPIDAHALRYFWWLATRQSSYVVDVAHVTTVDGAASYVAKYLASGVSGAKECRDLKAAYPRGARRYSTSRGVRLWAERVRGGYTITTRQSRDVARQRASQEAEAEWDRAVGAPVDYVRCGVCRYRLRECRCAGLGRHRERLSARPG